MIKKNSLDDVWKILQFFDDGMSVKDISKKSKEKLGYCFKENTILEILRKNNRLTVENVMKIHNVVSKKEIMIKRELIEKEIIKNEIAFSNNVPPHNVYYGFPL
jgi:phage-related tail protein